jgi:pilus assembly protein CpaC
MKAMKGNSVVKLDPSGGVDALRVWGRVARAALLAAAGAAVLLGATPVAGADTPSASTASPASPASPVAIAPVPTPVGILSPANDAAAFITEGPGTRKPLQILLNKSVVLNTRAPYKRVSIAQPDIADVNLLGPGNLLLTGKKAGVTQVIVWDDADKPVVLDVTVAVDVEGLASELKKLFPDQQLVVESVNGSVMIRGHVPSIATAEQVLQISKSYAPSVMDGLEISGGQQVCLKVRLAEVSRSADTELGINGGIATKSYSFGSNIANVNPTALAPGALPTTISPASAVSIYGAGTIGSVLLEGYIDALRENDLARVLAEPNLVTSSGQEATFMAGGSFPIPVAQGGGAGSGAAISIDYRDYGVKLKFTPVVMGNGRIRLKLSPEVSDLDYGNGVTLNGFVVPGTVQRNLTTTVEMADGQTLAVAGLLNSSISTSKSLTPVLGDIPVLGALFRSVRYQRKETELVILVTPHLVEAMNPAEVPHLPGENFRDPTENELFLEAYIGTPDGSNHGKPPTQDQIQKMTAEHRQTPTYYGAVGFVPPSSTVAPPPAPVATIKD